MKKKKKAAPAIDLQPLYLTFHQLFSIVMKTFFFFEKEPDQIATQHELQLMMTDYLFINYYQSSDSYLRSNFHHHHH